MVHRYHYASQSEICVGVFAVGLVDLVLRVEVLTGVAIQSPGKGGPFSVPSTARKVFAATLSGGGGEVAGRRFGPMRTG